MAARTDQNAASPAIARSQPRSKLIHEVVIIGNSWPLLAEVLDSAKSSTNRMLVIQPAEYRYSVLTLSDNLQSRSLTDR